MKDVKNIYLVGFMGTGKSAVSYELAKRLNRKSVDLDELIEKKEKKKISDIFAKHGEAYFRKLEKQTLSGVAAQDALIVSCGGGIVLDDKNISTMKRTGVVICLSSRPEVILDRTGKTNHRPLLNVENPKQRIEELLDLRAPYYAEADYTIDSSDIGISEIADIIVNQILANDKS